MREVQGKPARPSQVTQHMGQLDTAIGDIQRKVELLEERLTAVVLPAPPTSPARVNEVKEELLVSQASVLRGMTIHALELAERLQSLYDRIEL